MKEELSQHGGVEDIHDLHIWTLNGFDINEPLTTFHSHHLCMRLLFASRFKCVCMWMRSICCQRDVPVASTADLCRSETCLSAHIITAPPEEGGSYCIAFVLHLMYRLLVHVSVLIGALYGRLWIFDCPAITDRPERSHSCPYVCAWTSRLQHLNMYS